MSGIWKTLPEACQALNISERTVRRWIKSGKIRSKSMNGRLHVRLPEGLNASDDDRHIKGEDSSQLLELYNKILSEKDLQISSLQSEIQHLRSEVSRLHSELNASLQSEIQHLQVEVAKLLKETSVARQRADNIILQFVQNLRPAGQSQLPTANLSSQLQTLATPKTEGPTGISEADSSWPSVLEATSIEAVQPPAPTPLQTSPDDEKLSRLQQYVPEYLRDKILATKGHVEGERKPVTILFSDISGFTALSEKFIDDPEEVGLIIDNCHKTLGKVIYKYEGVVDKIIGDAIMALFGAPITHENDPERAVLAALEMMDEMKKLSADLSNRLDIPPLTIHIGINTGMVMVGSIGTDLRLDYTVMGDAVNLASRLEGVSKANQIVVSHNTYRLTKSFFNFKELEPVTVQGKKDPIQIYEVAGRKAKRLNERGLEGLETKLVGREEELKTLKKCADKLFETPQGQLISLIGEAGLGKSRLKAEFKKYLGDKATWLEGRCLSHTQNTSYSIFLSLIREYLDITEFSDEAEIRDRLFKKMLDLFPGSESFESSPAGKIVPYIGNLLSLKFEGEAEERLKYLDAQQLQTRTFMAVRDLLLAEAQNRPLIIALDDLHWIDDLSLNLVFFLVESTSEVPIITLCIYRPEKNDPCWQIGQMAYNRLPERYTEISLNKLTPEESESFIKALIQTENPDLTRLIMKKSEGNPFYIEEVIRTLITDGIMAKDEFGDWIVTRKVEDIAVPSTVEGVIMARIDRLLDESKYVLQRGSVIGRMFHQSILSDVCHDIDGLDDHLQNLVGLELIDQISPISEKKYIFRHILTYEMAYKSIMGPRRRDFHGRVAETIENLYAKRLDEQFEVLARHYSESNNVNKAVDYSIKAGNKAKAMYDNANAIHFYESALNKFGKLQPSRPDLQMEVYEGLGDVHMLISNYDDAINNYSLKVEMAEDPAVQARINRKIGGVYEKTTKYDLALEHFSKSLQWLGDDLKSSEAVEYARILDGLGFISWRRSQYDVAMDYCKQALKIVEGTDNYDVIANLYTRLGYISGSEGRGDIDLSINYHKQSLQIRQKIDDLLGESTSYNALGPEYRNAGRMDEALECYSQCVSLKTQIGDTQGLALAWTNMATLYYDMGQYDNAVENYQKAIETLTRIGDLNHIATAYNNLGMVYQKKDELEKAMGCYEKSMDTFDQVGATSNAAVCAYNIGDTYCDRGELDKAQSFLNKALDRFQKVGHAIGIARAYNSLGKTLYKLGNVKEAIEDYKKGLEISENSNDTRGRGLAYYELGRAYDKLKDMSLANDYLSKALEVFESLKAAPDIKKVKEAISNLTPSTTT